MRLGISAPFTGRAKELGQNMKRGIEAAFNVANTVAHPLQGLLAQLVS
jgi:ABC-type branched-subunit amino acid transport system substrate-binding protein